MDVIRTPDVCFANLPGFPYEPNYLELEDTKLGALRIHYIDEGPPDGQIVLCMHGEPSWSYLYRKMIPVFVAAGYRVIAPDLIGFGRSDKPVAREAYTYNGHVQWMTDWLTALDLGNIIFLGQDWGGLIGLRLVAENSDRFARVSLANTGLPTGDQAMPEAFTKWREFSQSVEDFDAGFICNNFNSGSLTPAEANAYRAPFPSEAYKAGARQFPLLVPATADDPASAANRHAWQTLMVWEKPMLLCFSDGDPITASMAPVFLKLVPGTKDQPHMTLKGGHFIQEQDGERWAETVVKWAGG